MNDARETIDTVLSHGSPEGPTDESPLAEAASILNSIESDAEAQTRIDRSLTAELAGVITSIEGIKLRPLTLSVIMTLHHAGNEVVAGTPVGEMRDVLYATTQALFVLDSSVPIETIRKAVFAADPTVLRFAVLDWAEKLPATSGIDLTLALIGYINAATSTRVTASLPDHLKNAATPGND